MERLMEELIKAVSELSVHTILDFAPIVLSVITAVVAICVPSRIAKKQNQIAVFDKLYTAYAQFLVVRSFAKSVQSCVFSGDQDVANKNRALFCVHFETAFGYRPDLHDYLSCTMSIGTATSVLRKSETQVYMLPMLISKDRKKKELCSQKISSIYEPLFLLVTGVIMPDPDELSEIDQNLKDFVAASDEFFSEYADTIEDTLWCKAK